MEEIAYSISAEDLAAANRLHFLKIFSVRRWIVTFFASAAIIALTIIAFDGRVQAQPYLLALLSIWGIIIAICGASWFTIPRQARRTWRQAQKMWIEQHVSYDSDKIHFRSERGQVNIGWGDYHRWASDDASLLLYQDARVFFLLPLRAFPLGAKEAMIGYLKEAGVQGR